MKETVNIKKKKKDNIVCHKSISLRDIYHHEYMTHMHHFPGEKKTKKQKRGNDYNDISFARYQNEKSVLLLNILIAKEIRVY